jgi:hypothetical protein
LVVVLPVIHPIARTERIPKLKNSFPDGAVIPEISLGDTIPEIAENAVCRLPVPEFRDPLLERLHATPGPVVPDIALSSSARHRPVSETKCSLYTTE